MELGVNVCALSALAIWQQNDNTIIEPGINFAITMSQITIISEIIK
jgi:hypothetical protein